MMKNSKALESKIEFLSKTLASFEKNLEKTNKRLEDLTNIIANDVVAQKVGQRFGSLNAQPTLTEQLHTFRAKTEQLGELSEPSEQPLRPESLNRIHGRHREILAMLINNGFHTYEAIAKKLNISQSRARAYIAELKNEYKVPLSQVRDPEGYKVGIDVRFIEQILSSKL